MSIGNFLEMLSKQIFVDDLSREIGRRNPKDQGVPDQETWDPTPGNKTTF